MSISVALSDDNQRAVIQAFVNPLVTWVWVGGLVLIADADLPGP